MNPILARLGLTPEAIARHSTPPPPPAPAKRRGYNPPDGTAAMKRTAAQQKKYRRLYRQRWMAAHRPVWAAAGLNSDGKPRQPRGRRPGVKP